MATDPQDNAKVPSLSVLDSRNGFFIGRAHEDGPDCVSVEYWSTKEAAQEALKSGHWAQRDPKSSAWERSASNEAVKSVAEKLSKQMESEKANQPRSPGDRGEK